MKKSDMIKDVSLNYGMAEDEIDDETLTDYASQHNISIEEDDVKEGAEGQEDHQEDAEDNEENPSSDGFEAYDPYEVLKDENHKYYRVVKHAVDRLSQDDAVGDENHPFHKPIADTKRQYTEATNKAKELEEQNLSLRKKLEVKESGFVQEEREGKTYLTDIDNNPHEGRYGGMKYEDALEDGNVADFNQAQYNYNRKVDEFKIKQKQVEEEDRQTQDSRKQLQKDYKTERDSFKSSWEVKEDDIVEIENEFSNRGISLEEAYLLDMAKKAGGVRPFIDRKIKTSALESETNPELLGGTPITNSDGNTNKGTPKGTFKDKSADEIMLLDDDEYDEYTIQRNQAITDGRLKLERK